MSKKPGIRPSELVLLAVHNLEREHGASERDIVRFISLRLNMKPDDIKGRIKAALVRSVALQLISQTNGRFTMCTLSHKKPKPAATVALQCHKTAADKHRPIQKLEKFIRDGKPNRRKNRTWRKPKPMESYEKETNSKDIHKKKKIRRCKCCGRRRRQMEGHKEGLTGWSNRRRLNGSLTRSWGDV